jgi:peptidoglycan/xylan/chitin deacetylase (PgdA/CDA1 family)
MTSRERISYSVRLVLSYLLYYSGVLHLVRRFRLRRKAVVLMYHRVLNTEQQARTASHPGLVVGDETFARHVAVLKRFFAVLTLDDLADHLASRVPFDRPSCLITFDDGWIDNLENALPILRKERVPAAMFLPVNFVGGGRLFTREALTHLLVKAIDVSRREPTRREVLRPLLAPLELDGVLSVADADPLPAVVRAVAAHRFASGPAFEATVNALSSELDVNGAALSDLDTFIDWSQVDVLAGQGFSFGGHGADHRVLTQVPREVVQCEVETSKKVLEAKLRRPVRAFAYPNGAWSAAIVETVKSAGYELAFTVEAGAVSCDDTPFSLRRVNIHDGSSRSTPMFLARLVGVL